MEQVSTNWSKEKKKKTQTFFNNCRLLQTREGCGKQEDAIHLSAIFMCDCNMCRVKQEGRSTE